MTWTRKTFVACILKSRFGDLQRPPDRWVGNNDAIIPHDCKAQIPARPVVHKIVLVFVPFLPNRKRVIEPWFSVNHSFHEDFDTDDAVCHGT